VSEQIFGQGRDFAMASLSVYEETGPDDDDSNFLRDEARALREFGSQGVSLRSASFAPPHGRQYVILRIFNCAVLVSV
jgi:hypothetical protein